MSVLPGYRGSGSTQPSSHHWIVCLNAVWHGPLFCPSVVKSQWTGGVWRDWGGKRIDVREKKIKKKRGEEGGWGWKRKRKTRWGEQLSGEKKIREDKGQKNLRVRGKLAINLWFQYGPWTLHSPLPFPGVFQRLSGPYGVGGLKLFVISLTWKTFWPCDASPLFKGLSHI